MIREDDWLAIIPDLALARHFLEIFILEDPDNRHVGKPRFPSFGNASWGGSRYRNCSSISVGRLDCSVQIPPNLRKRLTAAKANSRLFFFMFILKIS